MTDLLFDMADKACIRAWEDEGWGPYHKRLLTMCVKIEHPGRRKSNMNTGAYNIVENHLNKVGSISIREAMDDYSLSGGCLTKVISRMRVNGKTIHTDFKKHPITGRRYARYILHKDA